MSLGSTDNLLLERFKYVNLSFNRALSLISAVSPRVLLERFNFYAKCKSLPTPCQFTCKFLNPEGGESILLM